MGPLHVVYLFILFHIWNNIIQEIWFWNLEMQVSKWKVDRKNLKKFPGMTFDEWFIIIASLKKLGQ